jgi:hypothetical protein
VTQELPEKSMHAAKHGRKALLQIDGDSAMFEFNPAALEVMQELHSLALSHGHDSFDADAARIVKDLAYGKPITVAGAMSCMVTVAREAGECYARTGDNRVYEALHDLESALNGLDGNSIPTTVSFKPVTKGRGA